MQQDPGTPILVDQLSRPREHGEVTINDHASVHLGDVNTYMIHPASARSSENTELRKALYFVSMNSRKAQLDAIQKASFHWVWETEFKSWLSNTAPIFWISGKPASGKSTLMNYLANSPETLLHLRSSNQNWLICQFYFDFRAESGLANITYGLLKSLLFQLAEQDSEVQSHIDLTYNHDSNNSWTKNEAEVLSALISSIRVVQQRICLFVDGLDEFNGNLKILVDGLLHIQRSTGVKIVFASRPEPILQRMLSRAPSFVMQKYNHNTIRDYVRVASSALTPHEAEEMQDLWSTVEKEADGVILWAKFILDELVCQRVSGATMNELRHILKTFPTELEGVYDRILARVTPEQRLQVVMALKLLTENIDLNVPEFFGLWCALVEEHTPNFAFDASFDTRSLLRRLYSCLGGLVICIHPYDSTWMFGDGPFELCSMVERPAENVSESVLTIVDRCTRDCEIRLIHKTISSYLSSSKLAISLFDNVPASITGTLYSTAQFLLLREAAHAFQIDQQQYMSLIECRNSSWGGMLQDASQYFSSVRPWKHRLISLDIALCSSVHANLEGVDCMLLMDVVRSQLFRLHSICCYPPKYGCTLDASSHWISESESDTTWHLRCLAAHRQWTSFTAAYNLSRGTHSLAALDKLIKTLLELLPPAPLIIKIEPQGSVEIQIMEMIELVLTEVHLDVRYVAIYFYHNFFEMPKFVQKYLKDSPEGCFLNISVCPWHRVSMHDFTNLLYCWARSWNGEGAISQHLSLLLKIGLDINAIAYSGGTVMHALFETPDGTDPRDLVGSSTPIRTGHHILDHNVLLKYELLCDAGYDFKTTSHLASGTVETRVLQLQTRIADGYKTMHQDYASVVPEDPTMPTMYSSDSTNLMNQRISRSRKVLDVLNYILEDIKGRTRFSLANFPTGESRRTLLESASGSGTRNARSSLIGLTNRTLGFNPALPRSLVAPITYLDQANASVDDLD